MNLLFAGAVLLILLSGLFLWLGHRQRTGSGLPAGQVIYSDGGQAPDPKHSRWYARLGGHQWEKPARPLYSRRYGLVGRPDYLLQVREGHRTSTIPVEVKSRKRPGQPYASHILQLATYCLLVEENFEATPPYGLLCYADDTLHIPFTDALRRQVLAIADDIRQARRMWDIPRNHHEPARCRACSYRHACGSEALPANDSWRAEHP